MPRKTYTNILQTIVVFTVFCLPCFSQAPASCVLTSSVGIAAVVPATTLNGTKVNAITLSTIYPIGLSADAYISSQQLITDFQALITAYPNSTDPLAIMAPALLSSLLKKYPQFIGVSMSITPATTAGPYISASVYAAPPAPPPAPPTDGSPSVVTQPKL